MKSVVVPDTVCDAIPSGPSWHEIPPEATRRVFPEELYVIAVADPPVVIEDNAFVAVYVSEVRGTLELPAVSFPSASYDHPVDAPFNAVNSSAAL